MKSLKKLLLTESTFLVALLGVFLVRVTYALTRNLFDSAPDAPNYTVAPLDFAKYGFWSSHIQGGHKYPMGYPATLWPIAKFGGSHWVMFAQVWQILLSICTVYLVYRISQIFFENELALIIGFAFLLSPAFTPMSGEAMYEPLLMFVFYLYLFLVLKIQEHSTKNYILVLAGLFGGYTAVVHPRAIPWIIVIQIILFRRIKLMRELVFFAVLLIPVMLFALRNKIAEGTWALSSAADPWMGQLRPENIGTIIKTGMWNAIYFWSPYSGDAKRGTWMHNFTLYHDIKKMTHSSTVVIAIATVFAVVSIAAWILGVFLLMKSKKHIGSIVLYVPLLAWATDFFTYGDSRHRLVVMPLLLMAQVYAYAWIYRKVSHKSRISDYEGANTST